VLGSISAFIATNFTKAVHQDHNIIAKIIMIFTKIIETIEG